MISRSKSDRVSRGFVSALMIFITSSSHWKERTVDGIAEPLYMFNDDINNIINLIAKVKSLGSLSRKFFENLKHPLRIIRRTIPVE